MPHTESVLKTMKEYHPPFPSCKTQHLRRRGNCCDLGGTREAIKFIEHFMDCESSIRARREAEDVNIPNTLWNGYSHMLWKAGSQKQKFALRVVAPKDLANSSDPRGMWWSCMRWTDRSRSQQPYGSGDKELVIGKSVRKESLPRTPSQCSGEQLIYCVFMCGFGQP